MANPYGIPMAPHDAILGAEEQKCFCHKRNQQVADGMKVCSCTGVPLDVPVHRGTIGCDVHKVPSCTAGRKLHTKRRLAKRGAKLDVRRKLCT